MKIIKFKQKKNQKIYFINQEELINHLKNVVLIDEPEATNGVSDEFIVNESFEIGEWDYVDADLEYLDYGILGETEKWFEKKTGKILIVPTEIVRNFDLAEVNEKYSRESLQYRKKALIEAIVSLNDEDSVHFCNKWDLTHYGEERATDHLYNYAKNVVEGECKTIEDIKDMENYLNKYKLNK
tara:strand:+ start:264 stop:812 length:549 start_codon:yes stop_codon:yes gene_type:complete